MAEPITINLRHIARGLNVSLSQVEAVVELLDEGNTVPFITRYRKDQTGGLDEEKIRAIQANLAKARQLAERKQTILRSIEAQGKLTDTLAKRIVSASTMKRLEDLYLPYKPKKQSLATLARSRGLELLAQEILSAAVGRDELDARARDFANPDRQVPTAADALLGAGHILAEQFSENAELRQRLREVLYGTGRIVATRLESEEPTSAKPPEPPKPAKSARPQPARAGADAARQGAAEPACDPSASAAVAQLSDSAPVCPPSQTTVPDSCRVEASDGLAAPPSEAPGAPRSSPEKAGEGLAAAPSIHPSRPCSGLVGQEAPWAPAVAVAVPPAEETLDSPAEGAGAGGASGGQRADSAPGSEAPSGEAAASSTAGGPPQGAFQSSADVPAPPSPPPAAPADAGKPKAPLSKAELKRLRKEQHKKKLEERRLKAFADYFAYSEAVRRIPAHRILALNRGERAKILRVKIEGDLEEMYRVVDEVCVPADHPHADFLRGCARDALVRLILPSLEREVRRELTEQAEAHAVGVFARNLRKLLLQPPVRDRRVLAIDPGFKQGCKMVALDQFGNVLGHDTFFLVGNPERREEAKRKIVQMINQFQLDTVAIGNGTGSRQTEDFVAGLLGTELKGRNVAYVIVNEAGASVYSTSRIGREEFPQFDAAIRGAISIGRRLLDPLSELVKIEPANLGVGLYQHDVKAKHLRQSLDGEVESCVNYVGVDVNTASPALLRYVSGLNQLTAWRLYEYRVQNGPFRSRQQLREVPGIGEATFVQSAGFLKIPGGDNPLDATAIHPESYEIAGRVMARLGMTPADLTNREAPARLAERLAKVNRAALAAELQVGRMTLDDILEQLVRPGRDPREDLPRPIFKHGIVKLEDLTVGMELSGTVLNVVDFGAFVDIGMHDCGLVHVSQIADRFVRDPHELLAVGDVVKVWVLDVDKERRRVSLTMIPPGQARQGPHRGGSADRSATPGAQGQGAAQPSPGRAPRDPSGGAPRRPVRTPRTPPSTRPESPSGQAAGGHSRPPFVHRPSQSAGSGSAAGPAPPRRKPPPKPVTPLTEEMKSGKEPLRSFSDLLQFYQLQHGKLAGPEDPKEPDDQVKEPNKPGRRRRHRRGKPAQAGTSPPQGGPDPGERPQAPASRPAAQDGPGEADGPSEAALPAAGQPPVDADPATPAVTDPVAQTDGPRPPCPSSEPAHQEGGIGGSGPSDPPATPGAPPGNPAVPPTD